MKKHVLLTVSQDLSTQYTVIFVNDFFRNKKEMEITLLYIAPNPKQNMDFSQQPGRTVSEAQRISASYQQKGQEDLYRAANNLKNNGFDPDMIKSSLLFRTVSTPTEIARQANKGMYDAVLLGRRGLSLLEELIEGSTSRKVLDEQTMCPMWFCRRPEMGRKNVLLCTDGSRESRSIADHVGFMLENEPEHKITILHVRDGSEKRGEACISEAKQELLNNNIPETRMDSLVIPGKNPSRIISEYSLENNYAVIGMGRRGRGDTGLSRFFLGSNTLNLLKGLEKVSLWVYNG